MDGASWHVDVAAAAVAALPDLDPVQSVAPVPKGYRHECWRVVGRSGVVMVKLARLGTTPTAMANLAEALRLAQDGGVPTPRLLWSGISPAELGSRPMLVQEFLPGIDGDEALPSLNDAQVTAFYRDWGVAVGRMHMILPGRFSSSISEPHRCHESWMATVQEMLERLVQLNREAAVLSEETLEASSALILLEAERVSDVVQPSLSHGDLHVLNTLVEGGRFVAVLDFEHAKFWDPVFDFVKLRMWTFESKQGSESPFIDGYGFTAPALEAFDERLRVCTGLELLGGFPYWKRVNEPRLIADYRSRLDRLLGRPHEV